MAFIAVVALLMAACGRTPVEPDVELPSTPVISARPQWAVATALYTRIRIGPSRDAEIRGHLRSGDVAEVLSIETTIQPDTGRRGLWFEVRSGELVGWTPAGPLEFYESRSRAENAARFMKEEDR